MKKTYTYDLTTVYPSFKPKDPKHTHTCPYQHCQPLPVCRSLELFELVLASWGVSEAAPNLSLALRT
jgi:hypothetical protein